ncbi:MAG: integrase [Planctomycetota bacterium]|jgi:integrase
MSPASPLEQQNSPEPSGSLDRPAPLTEAELGTLIAAIDGRSVTAVRNRALVAFLAGSGCKIGEALGLLGGDLDFELCTMQLRGSSGLRRRRARLLPAAMPHVEAWNLLRRHLDSMEDGDVSEDLPFFCTRAGGSLEASYVRRLLPRLAHKAGLDRSVNAGLLRSTFAAHVYRLGASLPEIQRLLGHGDARSTLHLVRPVLGDSQAREQRPFRPEQWSLPGAAGTVRVELTVRNVASTGLLAEESGIESISAIPREDPPLEAQPDNDGVVIVPARWHEI